ncbi:MAG: alpha/beta fold hydrolase [Candidatus Solibacter usitatus]|nr:alpha/beta fold hydrolase [Candidatus Solibacter usitatus]
MLAAAAAAWAQPTIEGSWQASISAGNATLRLLLHISKAPDGGLSATFDSPDQGATGLSVSSLTQAGDSVKFTLAVASASFEGVRSANGQEISGQWKQGPGTAPMVFKRLDKAPAPPVRPQEPKKPYPYDEQEVVFENRKAGVKLAGALTLPRDEGPFPAAVLITGSGPQDRDEAIMGHRPFLVLADHLTRQGIAVLRYDDRGTAKSTGSFSTSTTADFADDAEAGVQFLKSHARIDAKRIGLIGHSEGGIIAPMVAARSADVAFIVLMAGTAVTGEQILYQQAALITKAGGAGDAEIAKNRAWQERTFAILKKESDPKLIEAAMRKAASEGLDPAGLEARVRSATSAWFRYFVLYDPAPALAKVKCPVLAINGERDLQVPPSQNLPVIEKALKAGGNRDFTVKQLPKLNHLFQTCQSGSPAEYAKIEETIAPLALETMSAWIGKRVKP